LVALLFERLVSLVLEHGVFGVDVVCRLAVPESLGWVYWVASTTVITEGFDGLSVSWSLGFVRISM
jgi:hypothetical protein